MIQTPFPRTSPEAVGLHSADIAALLERLSALPAGQEPHHFLLLRHGKVAAEGDWSPFRKGEAHNLASVSKAFTGTAVGFAVQEGLLSMDDRVTELFPDKLPEELQPEFSKITVRTLLEMGAGQEAGDAHGGIRGQRIQWQARHAARRAAGDLAQTFFTTPIIYEPGTVFGYNGMCSYLLSLAVTRRSGMDLMAYLEPRLFRPLGIETPACARDPQGVCIGQGGVCLSAEELAALGQFYLQKGMWNGRQLLNRDWMEAAASRHLPTLSQVGPDWSQGYCWQFWRGTHNTFRFCGAFGQMCVCMPDQDALFVIESGVDVDDMHRVLEAFYDTVIDRFAPDPLPEDPAAEAALRQRCAVLTLACPGSAPSPAAPALMGTWHFGADCPYASVTLELDDALLRAEFALRDGTRHTFLAGLNACAESDPGYGNESGADPTWLSCAWFEENAALCLRARERTGFSRLDVRLALEDGRLTLCRLWRRRRGAEEGQVSWRSV